MLENARRAKAVPAHQRRDRILAIQFVFINAYCALDCKTLISRFLYSSLIPRFSHGIIECVVMNVLVMRARHFAKFVFDLVGKAGPIWFNSATVE
jgi:hypothetical protein